MTAETAAFQQIRRIPLGALIGLIFTGIFLFVAIFAQWIAPYGLAEIEELLAQPAG